MDGQFIGIIRFLFVLPVPYSDREFEFFLDSGWKGKKYKNNLGSKILLLKRIHQSGTQSYSILNNYIIKYYLCIIDFLLNFMLSSVQPYI